MKYQSSVKGLGLFFLDLAVFLAAPYGLLPGKAGLAVIGLQVFVALAAVYYFLSSTEKRRMA